MGNKSSKKLSLPDMKLKMVLIGAAGAGKTSVFSRITSNQFSYHYTQTTSVKIGTIVKKINVPVECLVTLALWDLPGMEDMDLRKSYYENIDGAVIVVNINHPESIAEAVELKEGLLELTKTTSELATYEALSSNGSTTVERGDNSTDNETEKHGSEGKPNMRDKTGLENVSETTAKQGNNEPSELIKKLKDVPTLLLGSKVDEMPIEEEQEELHQNVVALAAVCKEANCTGWVPVSAKDNDRSIDLAFTSFLRYLVEKRFNLDQITGKIKGLEKIQVTDTVPTFIPPSTAATRLRERFQPEEDENVKRLPLIQHDPVDAEYLTIRKLIGKVRRGHKDWNLAYRRFRKSTYDYNIASTSCSIEELILNLKDKLPSNSLKIVEFQGWIKLELDDNVVDIDELEDDVLEVLDSFNYELFPNAAYVATTVKNAMMSITECKEQLSPLQVPVSCSHQVKLNNKEIATLLEMCESCTTEVGNLRKAVELAVMW